MDGVGTPIIGRPRPLPRHDTPNPAYHPHTLNYEEPVSYHGRAASPSMVRRQRLLIADHPCHVPSNGNRHFARINSQFQSGIRRPIWSFSGPTKPHVTQISPLSRSMRISRIVSLTSDS